MDYDIWYLVTSMRSEYNVAVVYFNTPNIHNSINSIDNARIQNFKKIDDCLLTEHYNNLEWVIVPVLHSTAGFNHHQVRPLIVIRKDEEFKLKGI